jgi:hypothetical protein
MPMKQLSDDRRAMIGRQHCVPILEAFNPVYGYWATERDLTREEVIEHFGANYVANMKQKNR